MVHTSFVHVPIGPGAYTWGRTSPKIIHDRHPSKFRDKPNISAKCLNQIEASQNVHPSTHRHPKFKFSRTHIETGGLASKSASSNTLNLESGGWGGGYSHTPGKITTPIYHGQKVWCARHRASDHTHQRDMSEKKRLMQQSYIQKHRASQSQRWRHQSLWSS